MQDYKQPIVTKWNWGAFMFTFFFGIAHRAYLALLILLSFLVVIPIIGWFLAPIFILVWAIITGLNGESWALKNPKNHYRDEEEFRKVMDGWNRAGFVGFWIEIGAVALAILILVIAITIEANLGQ